MLLTLEFKFLFQLVLCILLQHFQNLNNLDNIFYHKTLKSLYEKGNSDFSFIQHVKTLRSNLSAEYLDINITQQIIIDKYFDDIGKKDEFCNEYIQILHDSDEIRTPMWLSKIVNFLNGKCGV